MGKSKTHSKLFFVNRDDIDAYINDGKIDANDIVYTKDTHENIFITPEHLIVPIRSRVYRFTNTISAETSLNNSLDTYEGQIVAISSGGSYTAYIVNKNKGGQYYVTKLSEDANIANYDSLGNRPIYNLDGTLDEPIIVFDLDTGFYKIRGQYKLTEPSTTVYLSAADNIFLIDKQVDYTYIRKITARDIIDYKVENNSFTVTKDSIPTKEWVESKGYITESILDIKLAALNYMTKEDVKAYIDSVLDIDIDAKIDARIDQRIVSVDNSEVVNLF